MMTLPADTPSPRSTAVELHARALADPGYPSRTDPLKMLTFLRVTRAAIEEYEHACVRASRKAGATWEEVGNALGMARQNAQRKFGHR
jgi:hypothetical protein